MEEKKLIFRSRNFFINLKFSLILVTIFIIFFTNINVNAYGKISKKSHVRTNLRFRAPKHVEKLLEKLHQQNGDESSSKIGIDDTEEIADVGPFIGNVEISRNDKKKRNCGMSSAAARAIINHPSLKRGYFARTREEMLRKEDEHDREKREIKGNTLLTDGPLPWSCETNFQWKDMGPEHYPRFVRTAVCTQKQCFNGFFRCKPRRFKTKVLKRLTSENETCENDDDDVSLPETLRTTWKFSTITINLCCDCSGRIPPRESTS